MENKITIRLAWALVDIKLELDKVEDPFIFTLSSRLLWLETRDTGQNLILWKSAKQINHGAVNQDSKT